jgi:hypothetical protein
MLSSLDGRCLKKSLTKTMQNLDACSSDSSNYDSNQVCGDLPVERAWWSTSTYRIWGTLPVMRWPSITTKLSMAIGAWLPSGTDSSSVALRDSRPRGWPGILTAPFCTHM